MSFIIRAVMCFWYYRFSAQALNVCACLLNFLTRLDVFSIIVFISFIFLLYSVCLFVRFSCCSWVARCSSFAF